MKKSYLFGAFGLELDVAKSAVEQALDATLEAHESDYHGGDYFRFERDGAKLRLQLNFMEDDGETTEAEHPETVLLYLDGEAAKVESVSALVSERLNLFRQLRTSSY